MKRPVRPVALVILTLCELYPGLTSVFQGLYPWVARQEFALVGQQGVFVDLALKFGLPIWLPNLLKAAIGLAWLGGVPGRAPRGARFAAARPRSGRHGHHRDHLPHRVPRNPSAPAGLISRTGRP